MTQAPNFNDMVQSQVQLAKILAGGDISEKTTALTIQRMWGTAWAARYCVLCDWPIEKTLVTLLPGHTGNVRG